MTEMNAFAQVGVKINIVQNDQPSAEWRLEKSVLVQTQIQLVNYK